MRFRIPPYARGPLSGRGIEVVALVAVRPAILGKNSSAGGLHPPQKA